MIGNSLCRYNQNYLQVFQSYYQSSKTVHYSAAADYNNWRDVASGKRTDRAAGADVVAVGAAIYAAKSPGEAARRLREKIMT